MITAPKGIDDLLQQRPEWAPWLTVIRATLDELAHPSWDAAVLRPHATRDPNAPVLAASTVELDSHLARRAYDSVMNSAARIGSAPMASLQNVAGAALDPLAVLEAALNRDREQLTRYAGEANADHHAFCVVAALTAMPLLHACGRRCAPALSATWSQSYCPVCAGWPAFAEVRGIERSRYFRCGDCGGAWQASCLACAFCGMTDHEQLASLVPEKEGTGATIDVCNACRRYLKVFTTLRGALPAHVMLHDLATAELDIAASEHGYTRPGQCCYALELKVTANACPHLSA